MLLIPLLKPSYVFGHVVWGAFSRVSISHMLPHTCERLLIGKAVLECVEQRKKPSPKIPKAKVPAFELSVHAETLTKFLPCLESNPGFRCYVSVVPLSYTPVLKFERSFFCCFVLFASRDFLSIIKGICFYLAQITSCFIFKEDPGRAFPWLSTRNTNQKNN